MQGHMFRNWGFLDDDLLDRLQIQECKNVIMKELYRGVHDILKTVYNCTVELW